MLLNNSINLLIEVAPIITNGGKHPKDINHGNNKLPIIDPLLPNIMANETFIVLKLMVIKFK